MSAQKRKVMLIGNNVDKDQLNRTMNDISRDRDIKRLIFIGKYSLLMHFVIILASITFTILGILNNEWEYKTMTFASCLVFILFVYSLYGEVQALRENSITLKNYLKYLFSRELPKTPLDIWRFFQGSVADIQMNNTCNKLYEVLNKGKTEEIDNCDTAVIYSGEPYFETVCLDSVYIKWHNVINGKATLLKKILCKIRYIIFFKNYAKNSLTALAGQEYFINENKHMEFSSSVFGILYSSTYFFEEIRKINFRESVPIHISIDSKASESKKRKIAFEWMQYCTSDKIFVFKETPEAEFYLEVSDISIYPKTTFSKNDLSHNASFIRRIADNQNQLSIDLFNKYTKQDSKKYLKRLKRELKLKKINVEINFKQITNELNSLFKNQRAIRKGTIKLPIKKYIALHKSNVILESDVQDIFCVGGAEQNMALQQVINAQRWNSEGKYNVGFAENKFDNEDDVGFLVGSEGLVYGVRDKIEGRLVPNKESSCRAVVYKMQYFNNRNVNFYGIYGYSAMATKISLCKLIYSIHFGIKELNSKIENDTKYVPGESIMINNILDYCIESEEGQKITKTVTGRYFDNNDLMNNTTELINWLKHDGSNSIYLLK